MRAVRTYVVQRESWIRVDGEWLMWRVDRIQPGITLVDGGPAPGAEAPDGLPWRPSWPGTHSAVVSGDLVSGSWTFRFCMPDGY